MKSVTQLLLEENVEFVFAIGFQTVFCGTYFYN